MKSFLFTCFFFLLLLHSRAQQVILVDSSQKISIRGLSVVNKKVGWISGSKGMVGKTMDGGKTWEYFPVEGFGNRDFRDIEAFDNDNAVIMAVDEPAVILRTADGGRSWKTVYENGNKGMFLDAMAFWNEQSGIVIGDPINGKFFMARTFDGGKSWQALPEENLPAADSGEACFAASGTNIKPLDLDEACFITGGKRSRLFLKGKSVDLPLLQGKETTGANSIAVLDWKKRNGGKTFYIVGGDFAADSSSEKNSIYTHDGGTTWITPEKPPSGYKSCVEYLDANRLVSCGTSGVDVSSDGGKTWKNISRAPYHVVRKSKKGKLVLLAGPGGRIAKLEW